MILHESTLVENSTPKLTIRFCWLEDSQQQQQCQQQGQRRKSAG